MTESRASLVESVISRPESVVSVIEQKMPFKRTEVVITPPPPPVEQVFEQVETCLNLPPKRPPRSPSPNKMRRLSDVPKPVTPQPLQPQQPQQPQTPTQGNLLRGVVNCSSVAQSDVRRTWTTFSVTLSWFYTLPRDIHIECSKQFKWNSYFYESWQSPPFWAALKLL